MRGHNFAMSLIERASRMPTVARSRRDFLAWLAGASFVAGGCSAGAEPARSEGDRPRARDAGPNTGDLEEGDAGAACRPTTHDAMGPYHAPNAPVRSTMLAGPDEPGVRLALEGRLLGPDCRTPLGGYALDVWQADEQGNYHPADGSSYRLRGKIATDAEGQYRFETILPGRYGDAAGIRPAHLHVSFLTPGGNVLLTTQLYFAGDPYLGEADYCTQNGTCNSSDADRVLTLLDATLAGGVPGKRARFDAVLART